MFKLLANSFITVSKKHLSALAKMISQLTIDLHHFVIVLIDSYENLAQKALVNYLHIDKSYMVTNMNYLVERAYVIRSKNPNDRREQLIRLRDLANQSVLLIKNTIITLNKLAIQDICKSNQQLFIEVLFAIQNNIAISPQDIKINSSSILKNYN